MISKDIISRRIELISANKVILTTNLHVSVEEYTSSYNYYYLAERAFEIITQAMIDVGNHIISVNKFEKPSSYSNVFQILVKYNVLPKKLGNKLSLFVGLRNILAHEYLELDLERFYNEVKQELQIIDDFISHIVKYVMANE